MGCSARPIRSSLDRMGLCMLACCLYIGLMTGCESPSQSDPARPSPTSDGMLGKANQILSGSNGLVHAGLLSLYRPDDRLRVSLPERSCQALSDLGWDARQGQSDPLWIEWACACWPVVFISA